MATIDFDYLEYARLLDYPDYDNILSHQTKVAQKELRYIIPNRVVRALRELALQREHNLTSTTIINGKETDPIQLERLNILNMVNTLFTIPSQIEHYERYQKRQAEEKEKTLKAALETEPAHEKTKREYQLNQLKRELDAERAKQRKEADAELTNVSYFFDCSQDQLNLYFESPRKYEDSPIWGLLEKVGNSLVKCKLHPDVQESLTNVEMHCSTGADHRQFLQEHATKEIDSIIASSEEKRKQKLQELEDKLQNGLLQSYRERLEKQDFAAKKRAQSEVLKKLGVNIKERTIVLMS